jgi:hypothetical protein
VREASAREPIGYRFEVLFLGGGVEPWPALVMEGIEENPGASNDSHTPGAHVAGGSEHLADVGGRRWSRCDVEGTDHEVGNRVRLCLVAARIESRIAVGRSSEVYSLKMMPGFVEHHPRRA